MWPAGVMTPYLVKSRMPYCNILSTVYTKILYNKMAQYRFKNMSVACIKVKKAGKAAPPKTIDNGGTKKRHGRTM
jgi:hypothetical protein